MYYFNTNKQHWISTRYIHWHDYCEVLRLSEHEILFAICILSVFSKSKYKKSPDKFLVLVFFIDLH